MKQLVALILFLSLLSSLMGIGQAVAQPIGAIDQFRNFVQTTQSARADFTQTTTDARGKVGKPASGKVEFQRPGKFHWMVDKPAQTIVGDGKKVWLYDQDLNQVTIRKLEAAFSSTPAALLAGRAEVEAAFTLVAGGDSEDLSWVIAEPKQKDAGIEKIRMGFARNELRVMEIADAFGNKSRIQLSNLQRNPKLDAKQFSFAPPKGADVIGE